MRLTVSSNGVVKAEQGRDPLAMGSRLGGRWSPAPSLPREGSGLCPASAGHFFFWQRIGVRCAAPIFFERSPEHACAGA
ncbi:MAG TPA: hypothetical protein PLL72_00490 [Burkholderiaceae bacterium]|nr:hypothetical protein [Burkholderiaceae bacterium]